MPTLVLNMSQDAYLEDAQFAVKIDGVQQGAVRSVHASHGVGTEPYSFQVAAGQHELRVAFLNDAYGGAGQDRNLYLDSATLDGTPISGLSGHSWGGEDMVFGFTVPASSGTPAPTPAPDPETGKAINDLPTYASQVEPVFACAASDGSSSGNLTLSQLKARLGL